MQLMDEHTFQLPEVASTIVQTIGSVRSTSLL